MEYANPSYLVTTDWLADHLDEVRVLDVTAKLTSGLDNRAEEECFALGHIPGSLFFDVASGKGVLSDPDADLPWTWPKPAAFGATMARFGIDTDTRVVLVARTPRSGIDSGSMWCTRAWWTMHHFGVDCAILLGGLERWEREGRALTTEQTDVEPGSFTVAPGWERANADRDDVLAAVDSAATCLVDALPSSSYDGTGTAYGPRPGHIASAVNVPFRALIAEETAAFFEADVLASQLRAAGLLDAERVITYCGGAIAATVDAFALALLGHDNVAVYDASLMEWSSDDALPMATTRPLTAEDRVEIHELPGRYGDAIDDRNWDGLDRVFTEDAVFDLTGVGSRVCAGLDDIKSFMEHEAAHPRTHMMTNIYTDAEGDGARMRSRIVALLGKGLTGTASYYDTLVRTDDGWRIRHRICSTRRLHKRQAAVDLDGTAR